MNFPTLITHARRCVRRRQAIAATLILLLPLLAQAGGDEVAIVYNSNFPDSKIVAEHYAFMRHVPASQIFGFDLTTNETISRDDFKSQLQAPLADRLEDSGLWRFGSVTYPATNGQPARTVTRVIDSKIRYLALCYGVPLKIAPSSMVEEMTLKFDREELRVNEASVDSELTWLPLSRSPFQLAGPIPNPFYGTTNRDLLCCTNGILLVTRLDGPTLEIANSLVDKAMDAESNGLWGRTYFDTRGLDKSDRFYLGDEWLLGAAEVCRLTGFDVDIDTNAATYPASFPMSQIAIYAGWYDASPSGPFKAHRMEFMPGAFAYHLYSYNAETLRDTQSTWCGALLERGATCTMGSVYEPYLQFTPNIASFLYAWAYGATFGEAAWISENAVSWHTTMVGDPLYCPFEHQPLELHARLSREKSPLLAWSFEHMVNMDRIRGAPLSRLADFLESISQTKSSAVLTEKLADIYDAQGKPDSAIDAWQRALTLNPTPEQRIRLRLTLGEKLLANGQTKEAVANWQQLILEAPGYPGDNAIQSRMDSILFKSGHH